MLPLYIAERRARATDRFPRLPGRAHLTPAAQVQKDFLGENTWERVATRAVARSDCLLAETLSQYLGPCKLGVYRRKDGAGRGEVTPAIY
jgi:hypothetical protein